MKATETYTNEQDQQIVVEFDDLRFKPIESEDGNHYFECRGQDERLNLYSGTALFCCDELVEITNIELLLPVENRGAFNFDPNPPVIL